MRDKSQVVLPLDSGICIPEGDFAFKAAEICERLDYTELWKTYVRAWRKVNPVTMLEIPVFAYMNRKISSREIEKACKTDIRFLWLLGGEPPLGDSMITGFMRGHLGKVIEGLFTNSQKSFTKWRSKIQESFCRWEAYANKYTMEKSYGKAA